MIDLLSDEHVQALIEQRKQEFKFNSDFYVITSLNHVFNFWYDGDVSILNEHLYSSYQPEIAKLYDAEYYDASAYIKNPKTCKHLYDLFIGNPECLFFHPGELLRNELNKRRLSKT